MVCGSICRLSMFVLVGFVLSGFAPGCSGSIGVPTGGDVAESDSRSGDLGCQCTSDDECLAPIGGTCAGSARCIDCLCTVESADSDACTPEDMCALPGTCQGAICVPAGQVDCDDGDDCTKDSCAPATGCLNDAIPDCPPVVCGDGECSATETCMQCPGDCGECPVVCGDDECTGDESCDNCEEDCGECTVDCGDGECTGDETAVSCHADCAPKWMNMSDPQSHGTIFEKDPAACQTCHLSTLDGGAMSCEICHPKWQATCTFCHGGKDNQTGAPPESVDGQTANTVAEIGAHTMHVTATPMKEAYTCASCHAMPADALSDGHVDGGKAETQIETCGLKATYTAGKCSSVYCHGNGKSTAAGGNATWTGAAVDCDSCHPQAGLGGKHSLHLGKGFSCDTCHGDTVSDKGTISNPAKHVNCVKDVKGAFIYTPGSKTCSNVECHESETW